MVREIRSYIRSAGHCVPGEPRPRWLPNGQGDQVIQPFRRSLCSWRTSSTLDTSRTGRSGHTAVQQVIVQLENLVHVGRVTVREIRSYSRSAGHCVAGEPRPRWLPNGQGDQVIQPFSRSLCSWRTSSMLVTYSQGDQVIQPFSRSLCSWRTSSTLVT